MLCIFEGCDGAGKTQLAEELAAFLRARDGDDSVELLHYGPPERDVLQEYAFDLERYRPDRGKHLVIDRLHVGNLIYGPLYRGKDELGVAGFRFVELFLASRGAVTFIVDQPLDVLQQRLADRGEDYLQAAHVEHVKNEYLRLSSSLLTFGGIVSPQGNSDGLVADIVKIAEYYEATTSRLDEHPSYIGRPTPGSLLVAEKRGGEGPWPTECALAPALGGKLNSSRFFLEALPETLWREVGVVNALEEPDLAGLVDQLGDPAVVALGRVASDELLGLDIEHGGVPHPQYARRFASKKQKEYGIAIERATQTGEANFSWPN